MERNVFFEKTQKTQKTQKTHPKNPKNPPDRVFSNSGGFLPTLLQIQQLFFKLNTEHFNGVIYFWGLMGKKDPTDCQTI